jgi:hypothetical protein
VNSIIKLLKKGEFTQQLSVSSGKNFKFVFTFREKCPRLWTNLFSPVIKKGSGRKYLDKLEMKR